MEISLNISLFGHCEQSRIVIYTVYNSVTLKGQYGLENNRSGGNLLADGYLGQRKPRGRHKYEVNTIRGVHEIIKALSLPICGIRSERMNSICMVQLGAGYHLEKLGARRTSENERAAITRKFFVKMWSGFELKKKRKRSGNCFDEIHLNIFHITYVFCINDMNAKV